MQNYLVVSTHLKNIRQIGNLPWTNVWLLVWGPAVCDSTGFSMKAIVNKKGTLRIPNHRAPNQQLTISSKSASVSTRRCATKSHQLENIVYHFLRQLWLFLGVNLMEINSNDCFPGICLVIQSALLRWLSDPLKWLSDLQRSGMKRSRIESPHTTPVVAVMLLFLVNARFIRSWMPWRQPPRWNFSVDLLLEKLRHPWDKKREQTCDLKICWCPPKKEGWFWKDFPFFACFVGWWQLFSPNIKSFADIDISFENLERWYYTWYLVVVGSFFSPFFLIAVDSANSKLLVWGPVVWDLILGVPLSNNPFP